MRSPAAVGWLRRDKRRLVGGDARASGILCGMAKVRQHLAKVELQRPAFALDPFDLVLENLVCLLRLFELDA